MNPADAVFQRALAAFNNRNYPEAERLFRVILKRDRTHLGALNLLAIALMSAHRFAEAEEFIAKAVRLNPESDVSLYNYGLILKQLGKPREALAQFDRALSVNPRVADTWNNRGSVFNDLEEFERAVSDFDKAIALNPNYFAAFCNKGNALSALKRFDEAQVAYAGALALDPNLIEAWLGCGRALHECKRYNEAVATYDRALAFRPDSVDAWVGRGNALALLKRYEEASSAYDTALGIRPDLPNAWLGRGNILYEQKRYGDAHSAYDKSLALQPTSAEAWLGRANVDAALKCYDAALKEYDKALALNPGLPNIWLGYGNLFYEFKRYDEALAAYDRALSLTPDLAGAVIGRANVYYDLKRYDSALAIYDQALALTPNLAEAWLGRGNIFDRLKRHEEAALAYAKVLEVDSQYPFAKGMLLHEKMLACDWSDIDRLIVEIDEDIDAGRLAAEPFGYQAIAQSPLKFKLCAENFARTKFPPLPTVWQDASHSGDTRLRIGYVSGELRDHVMGRLMAELFELHDKDRFELHAFDNGWDDGSETRKRIHNAFDSVVDISSLDDSRAARAIHDKRIDLLVNLNGYFGDHRTRVFSYRPAPIQVSYLGFSATMGADYIDYIVADRYIIPPEQQAYYTEKVVYLPDTFQVNDRKRRLAERLPTRSELKLPDDGFVFCCFNNSFKITPEIFEVWMRLLHKVDGSVLWLAESNAVVTRNLRVEAQKREIDPNRLVFASWTNEYRDHLARYQCADLFLDTMPFNAGGTASDALWAGLPLLTCSGQSYTARMAGSLLHAVGLPELVALTLDDYERMAIDLARHPDKLAELKRRLVENRLTTPLFDTKRLTRHLEMAFTMMHARHQAGLPPDHLVVSS